MRKLAPSLVALAVLMGTGVATFAAESSSAPRATVKGGANPSGAAGTANHSNTATPGAATNPPPTTGCGTHDHAMKQARAVNPAALHVAFIEQPALELTERDRRE